MLQMDDIVGVASVDLWMMMTVDFYVNNTQTGVTAFH